MNLSRFQEIYAQIESREDTRTIALSELHSADGVSYNTLLSIYGQKYQHLSKKAFQHHKRPEQAKRYYEMLTAGGGGEEDLLDLAESINIAPCLLARIVLEQHIAATPSYDHTNRKLANQMIHEPSLIAEPWLRAQVEACVNHDDNYSPLVEKIRHTIGNEYEYKLQEKLINLKIPFLTETDMRDRGYPKTPDIKLEIPILIDEKYVVNWIESKASFGDLTSHNAYLENQFTAYSNRYGPGLVIYWFGHVQPEEDSQNGVIVRDRFPSRSSITTMSQN